MLCSAEEDGPRLDCPWKDFFPCLARQEQCYCPVTLFSGTGCFPAEVCLLCKCSSSYSYPAPQSRQGTGTESRVAVTSVTALCCFECPDYLVRCWCWPFGQTYSDPTAFVPWAWSELCKQSVKNVTEWSSGQAGVLEVPLRRGSAGHSAVIWVAL